MMSMLLGKGSNLVQHIKGMVADRQSEVGQVIWKCTSYRALSQRSADLSGQVQELLDEKGQALFTQYDEVEGLRFGQEAEETYLMGLRDGLALAELISNPGNKTIYRMVEEKEEEDASPGQG